MTAGPAKSNVAPGPATAKTWEPRPPLKGSMDKDEMYLLGLIHDIGNRCGMGSGPYMR